MEYHFYVGSYNSADEDSIYYCSLDSVSGEMKALSSFKGLANPSYLAWSLDHKYLFAVEELNPTGNLVLLRMNGEQPEFVTRVSTDGADPCHISVDKSGSYICAANYSSGSLAAFHFDEAKEDLHRLGRIQEEGSGPNKERQECAHIHFSGWIGDDLYVCDLGSDLVRCFHREGDALTEDPSLSMHVNPGYGPRHFAASADGKNIYLITEMGSRICVFEALGSPVRKWSQVQESTTQSPDYRGEGAAAAIRMNAEESYLFTSDRSSNSIASYRVGVGGQLSRSGDTPTGGIMPRDFAIFGDIIVVANQESSTLTAVRISQNGKLQLLDTKLEIPHPSCVLAD
ncbi:MAG: lactonase family protein [Lachnospiraceae bacterium]|nr:lactonase family protein [Lachnospiraceae bacterium]